MATTTALQVVTWVGAITAVFAASIAVAQNDIKRILAYSTVSQLGYMMMGLGVGGVSVGMFHLITHAFFKALLFLGAGSVIHACHEEQDIRRMGGLWKYLPVTFATYAIGMLALCGFPIFFSGFWSKDEILHSAHLWQVSQVPFYLGILGALLTAFYMTRQVCYVFFGPERLANSHSHEADGHGATPQESPAPMTIPLMLLAAFALLLSLIGTPAWPWFHAFLMGEPATVDLSRFFEGEILPVMLTSSVIVFLGLGLGWWFYGRKPVADATAPDALERIQPAVFRVFQNRLYVDEFYEATVVRFQAWAARACDFFDRWVWNGAVQFVAYLVLGLSWLSRLTDTSVVNLGFDKGCGGVTVGSRILSRLQSGQAQSYLRILGVAFVILVLVLIWSSRG
jgi:NADH-quinone oxidoreductase subunit L